MSGCWVGSQGLWRVRGAPCRPQDPPEPSEVRFGTIVAVRPGPSPGADGGGQGDTLVVASPSRDPQKGRSCQWGLSG